jgi:hypothetical protein
MRATGAMAESGFARAEDWLAATRDHDYVDPPRRIFNGFNAHVRNRADVIVSFADGYLLGNPVMGLLSYMRATHGNLLRGETEGFAMSMRQDLGGAVRGTELARLFKLDEMKQTAGFFGDGGHCQVGPALARMIAGE